MEKNKVPINDEVLNIEQRNILEFLGKNIKVSKSKKFDNMHTTNLNSNNAGKDKLQKFESFETFYKEDGNNNILSNDFVLENCKTAKEYVHELNRTRTFDKIQSSNNLVFNIDNSSNPFLLKEDIKKNKTLKKNSSSNLQTKNCIGKNFTLKSSNSNDNKVILEKNEKIALNNKILNEINNNKYLGKKQIYESLKVLKLKKTFIEDAKNSIIELSGTGNKNVIQKNEEFKDDTILSRKNIIHIKKPSNKKTLSSQNLSFKNKLKHDSKFKIEILGDIHEKSLEFKSKSKSPHSDRLDLEIKDKMKSNRKTYKLEDKIQNKEFVEATQSIKISNYDLIERVLKRDIRPVYDSLSDNENIYETDESYTINPTDNMFFILNYITLLFLLVTVFYSTINMAFNLKPNHLSMALDFLSDIMNIVLLISNFFTAYYDVDDTIISNRKSIVKKYLSSWFIFDLITSIPINIILDHTTMKNTVKEQKFYYYKIISHSSNMNMLKLVKYLQIFKILNKSELDITNHLTSLKIKVRYAVNYVLRFLYFMFCILKEKFIKLKMYLSIKISEDEKKLLEYTYLNNFTYSYKDFINNSKLYGYNKDFHRFSSIYVIFVQIIIFLHLVTLIHICITNYSGLKNSWIDYSLTPLVTNADVYITSFYFILASIFSIGYGDISSFQIEEKVFNIFLMVFGIFLYSLSVSMLSFYVYQTSEDEQIIIKKEETLTDLSTIFKLKTNLTNKISNYMRYNLIGDKLNKNFLFSEMPISIKRDILFNIYKNEITYFYFLNKIENYDILLQICIYLKQFQGYLDERIIEENTNIEEMIFIKNGKMKMTYKINLIKLVFNLYKEIVKDKKHGEIGSSGLQVKRFSKSDLKISNKGINEVLPKKKSLSFDYNLRGLSKSTKKIIMIKRQKNLIKKKDRFNLFKEFITKSLPNLTSFSKFRVKSNDEDFINEKYELIDYKCLSNYINNSLITLRKWDSFGDILLFTNEKSPVTLTVKSSICDYYSISKDNFEKLINRFKDQLSKPYLMSKYNFSKFKERINVKYQKIKLFLKQQIMLAEEYNSNISNNLDDDIIDNEIFISKNIDYEQFSKYNSENTITLKNENEHKIVKLVIAEDKEMSLSSSSDSDSDNNSNSSIILKNSINPNKVNTKQHEHDNISSSNVSNTSFELENTNTNKNDINQNLDSKKLENNDKINVKNESFDSLKSIDNPNLQNDLFLKHDNQKGENIESRTLEPLNDTVSEKNDSYFINNNIIDHKGKGENINVIKEIKKIENKDLIEDSQNIDKILINLKRLSMIYNHKKDLILNLNTDTDKDMNNDNTNKNDEKDKIMINRLIPRTKTTKKRVNFKLKSLKKTNKGKINYPVKGMCSSCNCCKSCFIKIINSKNKLANNKLKLVNEIDFKIPGINSSKFVVKKMVSGDSNIKVNDLLLRNIKQTGLSSIKKNNKENKSNTGTLISLKDSVNNTVFNSTKVKPFRKLSKSLNYNEYKQSNLNIKEKENDREKEKEKEKNAKIKAIDKKLKENISKGNLTDTNAPKKDKISYIKINNEIRNIYLSNLDDITKYKLIESKNKNDKGKLQSESFSPPLSSNLNKTSYNKYNKQSCSLNSQLKRSRKLTIEENNLNYKNTIESKSFSRINSNRINDNISNLKKSFSKSLVIKRDNSRENIITDLADLSHIFENREKISDPLNFINHMFKKKKV